VPSEAPRPQRKGRGALTRAARPLRSRLGAGGARLVAPIPSRGGGGAYPYVIFFGDTYGSERGAAPPPGRVPRFRDPSDGPPRDVHVNFRAPTPDVGVAKKMTSGVRTPTTPRPQEDRRADPAHSEAPRPQRKGRVQNGPKEGVIAIHRRFAKGSHSDDRVDPGPRDPGAGIQDPGIRDPLWGGPLWPQLDSRPRTKAFCQNWLHPKAKHE